MTTRTLNEITDRTKMDKLTLPMIQRMAKSRGIGEVSEVIQTATVLHRDWERDNEAYAVRMRDGTIKVLSTNNGGLCEMNCAEIADKLSETQSSINQLEIVLELAIKGR